MAKLPQIVQQQSTVANIQQIVSSPQQVGVWGWVLLLRVTSGWLMTLTCGESLSLSCMTDSSPPYKLYILRQTVYTPGLRFNLTLGSLSVELPSRGMWATNHHFNSCVFIWHVKLYIFIVKILNVFFKAKSMADDVFKLLSLCRATIKVLNAVECITNIP